MLLCTFSPSITGIVEWNLSFSQPLGRGANATVYKEKIGSSDFAIKIYEDPSKLEFQKLLSMIENPPNLFQDYGEEKYPTFGWALSIISDKATGQPVGFVMPLVDEKNSKTLDFFYDYNLSKRLKSPISRALSFKVEILANLSSAIADLHSHGHQFVDLKPQNLRVFEGTNIVSLIDCDGYSIKDKRTGNVFRATMVSPDYIAPELSTLNLNFDPIPKSQDEYALAVIIFQMLNKGIHPFQGVLLDSLISANTNDEKAALGLYAYGIDPSPKNLAIPSSIHKTLLLDTRYMFDRAFSSMNRPSAVEWASHFKKILTDKLIVRCPEFPENVEHMRFSNLECPVCIHPNIKDKSVAKSKVPSKTIIASPKEEVSTSSPKNNIFLVYVIGLIGLIMIVGYAANQNQAIFGSANSGPSLQPQSQALSTNVNSVQKSQTDLVVSCQKGSLDACNLAIRNNNNDKALYNFRAHIQMATNPEAAMLDYSEAIWRGSTVAYYNRGLVEESLGKLQLALTDFKKYLEVSPNDPDGPKAVSRVEAALKKNITSNSNQNFTSQGVSKYTSELRDSNLYSKLVSDCSELDISTWQHPIRVILSGQKIDLQRVEACKNKSYYIFSGNFGRDPNLNENQNFYSLLLRRIATANGWWPYVVVDLAHETIIYVNTDRGAKTFRTEIENYGGGD